MRWEAIDVGVSGDENVGFFSLRERPETGVILLCGEFLKYKPLSQHTGTTRARTGADWHTHRLQENFLRTAGATRPGSS